MELPSCASLKEVAHALRRFMRAEIGCSGFTFVPIGPGQHELDDLLVKSDEFPDDVALAGFLAAMPQADQELARIPVAMSRLPHTADIYECFDYHYLSRTVLFNEYWRPQKVERSVTCFMGEPHAPLAMMVSARAAAERPFVHEHVELIDRARVLAEPYLRAYAGLPLSHDAGALVDLLDRGLPMAAAIFDATGRLLWISQEARVHFEITAIKLGCGSVLGRNRAIEHLQRIARTVAARPEQAANAWTTLDNRERLLIRRLEDSGGAKVLISLEPCTRCIGPFSAESARALGLTSREAEVALLAAEGFSVLNISTRLNLSESTVRTHLRKTYLKLHIGSRAELACCLLGITNHAS